MKTTFAACHGLVFFLVGFCPALAWCMVLNISFQAYVLTGLATMNAKVTNRGGEAAIFP